MTENRFAVTLRDMNRPITQSLAKLPPPIPHDPQKDRFAAIIHRVQADPEYVKARRHELNEPIRARVAYRKKLDPHFKLLCSIRSRAANAMRGKGRSKSTPALLGCTAHELRAHIEKQFLPGMTWENRSKWHVDHIRPCASFNLFDPAQQAACFHFSNLQPLWAKDNLRKSDKWTPPEQCR